MRSRVFDRAMFRFWMLALACVALLVACTPSSPPPAKMPEVVWQDGRAPSGPYEGSKWVKAAREIDVAMNAAWNAGDFRITELDGIDSVLLSPMYHNAQYDARKGKGTRFPGPTPSIVISVKENKAQRYMEVVMCAADDWTINKDRRTPPQRITGSGVEYDLYDFGKGVRLDSMGGLGKCTLKDPAIGYFKPAPDPTESRKPSDIKGPPKDWPS